MKFVNYAIVRFSLFLTLGILAAHTFPVSFVVFIPIVIGFVAVLGFWLQARKRLLQSIGFGMAVYGCFFFMGYALYQRTQPEFQPHHYSHKIEENQSYLVQLKIGEVLKPDAYNAKYYATVRAVDTSRMSGKVLLLIPKDSVSDLKVDELLLVYGSFSTFGNALNPGQFDYAAYMRTQEVHHQIRLSNQDILRREEGRKTFFGSAQRARQKLIDRLQETTLSVSERSIVQALILGDKRDIDKTLYEDYAAAGAVHILAVSGLHVGILFVILNSFFAPLQYWRYGRYLRVLLIVLCLWMFAFIAGLSPSVVRSVSMFSFFALAMILGRRTNGLNNLFLSYLVLLLIQPLWLFQVGFQLSYAAVFSILWMLPKMEHNYIFHSGILRKTEDLIRVSLAAQLGVLPLTLFYFHQFPGLFLLTNLVVLPALAVFMVLGIGVVVLGYFVTLPEFVVTLYGFMLKYLNLFIGWVAQQDRFLLQEISFSQMQAIGLYLAIFAGIWWLKNRRFSRLLLFGWSLTLFFGIHCYEHIQESNAELLVFHKNRTTMIGFKQKDNLTIFTADTNSDLHNTYPLQAYRVERGIATISQEKIPEVFQYQSKMFLVVDSLGTLPKKGKVDVLVLTQSPKINLGRVIDSLQPSQIIADGSNYPSFVSQWERQSKQRKVLFHNTARDGAFVMR